MKKDLKIEQLPTHIARFKTTQASPERGTQLLAEAFRKDGFTAIVVTHDGLDTPSGCIGCKPVDLKDVLGETMLMEMDQLRERKVIVLIDAQPVFHEGKAYPTIKPGVVSALVEEMQRDWPDDDLSAIYIHE